MKRFILLLVAVVLVVPMSAQSLKKKNEMRASLINALTESVEELQAKLAEDESTFRTEIESLQQEIGNLRSQQEKQANSIK